MNLRKLLSFSFKFSVLVSKNCISKITKPIPNSTAENTKTKNDNERMFKLSYTRPVKTVNKYTVIQINSAVNNKCNDVFTWISNVLSNIKKSNTIVLKSPMNKINNVFSNLFNYFLSLATNESSVYERLIDCISKIIK